MSEQDTYRDFHSAFVVSLSARLAACPCMLSLPLRPPLPAAFDAPVNTGYLPPLRPLLV
jgi:hypothetical protein